MTVFYLYIPIKSLHDFMVSSPLAPRAKGIVAPGQRFYPPLVWWAKIPNLVASNRYLGIFVKTFAF